MTNAFVSGGVPPVIAGNKGRVGSLGRYRWLSVALMLLGGFWNQAFAQVNQPPAITITSPASGTTFTAPASITGSAQATDSDGTIAQVDVYDGTTLLGTVTSAPYNFSVTDVSAGTYTITAQATDDDGATTTSEPVVIVVQDPQNQPPTIAITSPASGTTFTAPASITGSAQATDSDGTIVRVDVYDGTTLLGTVTSAPYNFSVTDVPAGTYTITAQATDDDGATTTSEPVVIVVQDPQNQPPTIAITSPASGTTFTAPASITGSAQATDSDGTIVRVDVYDGTTLLGTVTSAPYNFSVTDVPAGTYTITAQATDDDGATTTSEPVVIVVQDPQNQAPTVALTSPAAGASFTAPASINLTADAADSDGNVASVAFYNGATLLGTDTAAPFSFNWSDVPAGTYSVTARATDDDGATTTSAPVSVTVTAPANQAPTVALTSPTAGASFTAPANISLAANASDSDGSIASVSFYNGATLLGTDTSAPFSFNWTGVPAGTYNLTARATDDEGAVTTSAAVSVTVDAPQNQAPTVELTSPAAGASFDSPAAINLGATAADTDGTIASVAFYNGATLLGTDTTAPFSFNWSDVPVGTYTVTARATDDDGATTTSAAVSVTVVAPQNQAPTVALTSPAAGASFDAPATINLSATASDTDGSVTGVAFYSGATLLGTDTSAPFSFSWTDVPAGTYSLTARATDDDGAATTSAAVSVTVDAPQNQAPTVALTSPLAGALFAEPASITLVADAADSDGSIASVAFFNGPTLLGTATSAPYSFDWVDVPAGSYNLTAVATGDDGLSATSAPVSITVAAPPRIRLLGFDSGGPYGEPGGITIDESPANVTIRINTVTFDGHHPTVAFYANGILVGTNSPEAAEPSTFEWTNVPRGIYTLTAVATDSRGLSATSDPVGLSVDCRIALAGVSEGRRYRVRSGAPVRLVADSCIGSVDVAGVVLTVPEEPEFGVIYYATTESAPSFPADLVLDGGGTVYRPLRVHVHSWMVRPDGVTLYFFNGQIQGFNNPSVSLVAPAAGSVYAQGQDIELQAVALDCSDCTSQVDFYLADAQQSGSSWIPVNERLLGSLPGHAQFLDDIPYELTWSAPSAGRYFLRARAIDTDGVVVESEPVQIRVVAPPQVSILSPSTGDTYEAPANILITASATSNGEPVARVDFYRGATLLGTDTTAPFEFNWTGAPEGSYVLTAVATNAVEVSVTSEPVTVTVNASPSETITYIHTDLSGSPLAATNANGNVVWKENYRAYGERRLGQPGSEGQRQWFHGKEADASTGLQYFGARYYDPAVGRFMGVDPVSFQEGNLHSFNRYAYGNNNPVRYLDPDGNNAVTAFGGLLTESYNFLSGQGFNGAMVLGALKDGYDGEGAGFWNSAGEDASLVAGAAIGVAAKLIRAARAVQATNSASFGQIKTALASAQRSYKGSTVVGHALSKHAGRNPEIWGKMTGSMKTWNDQAMKHFREISRGPGDFHKVTENGVSFMEKRLSDGRGIRLNMDSTFKGFID